MELNENEFVRSNGWLLNPRPSCYNRPAPKRTIHAQMPSVQFTLPKVTVAELAAELQAVSALEMISQKTVVRVCECVCFVCVLVVQGYRSCYSRGISLHFLKWFFSAFLARSNKMLESLIRHHRRSPLMSWRSDIVSIGRLYEIFWIILSWLRIGLLRLSCGFEGPLKKIAW